MNSPAMPEKDEDIPLGSDSKEDCYWFPTASALDAAFAHSITKNLRLAGETFATQLTSRDGWIKMSADTVQKGDRVTKFLDALQNRMTSLDRDLDQREFELILTSFRDAKENALQSYFAERIRVSPRKHEIVPRTPNQLEYIRAIREKDVVFGVGPAGTGKTYLAMAMAVSSLLAGKYDRIILTRPAVEAGENLGFLPGKLEEKINPYLRPLYDALYDMLDFSEAESLIEKTIIEVAPLAFMRGRTLNHAFVILDEAQNTTNEQMMMFLTRLGFHSQCVVCGDPTQTDLPKGKPSGLTLALRKLSRIEEIGICHMTARDVIRHSLVEKIIRAYEYRQDASGEDNTMGDRSVES